MMCGACLKCVLEGNSSKTVQQMPINPPQNWPYTRLIGQESRQWTWAHTGNRQLKRARWCRTGISAWRRLTASWPPIAHWPWEEEKKQKNLSPGRESPRLTVNIKDIQYMAARYFEETRDAIILCGMPPWCDTIWIVAVEPLRSDKSGGNRRKCYCRFS